MADSVPASTSSTVTITVGMPLNGEIETSGDEDWYRVALTANTTYTIRLVGRGTGSNTLEDPLIDGIYNSSGNYLGYFNNDGLISGPYGRDAMTTFTPTTSGNYWIAALGDLGTIGTFTISVTNSSGSSDNVAATTATTGIVTVGGAINGTIDAAGDVDWYRVALNAGATYTFRLLGLTTGVGTLADPVIAGVYNSSGVIIPNTYIDDFTTRDAVLTFAAPTTGNYYIAARGWSTYTGTFRLEVANAAPDVGSTTSTATSLAIGSSTTVSIGQPYDHDWYGVSLVAGRTYEFSLSGTGFDNTTPFIHGIFNSVGQYIGAYSGPILGVGAAAATTTFTPTTSGTYYIDAFSIYEGTYTLSAQEVTNDVPDNRTTTATVAVGGSVTGHIGGATDIDWYAVTLVGNTTYEIRMQGSQSGVGTLADPIIAGVYNSSGVLQSNTFADDNDGNEAALIFRPTASGTYYIAADGYAGYTGTFRLSVATLAGDIGGGREEATTLHVNTPTTVTIDNAADTDWYKVDLTAGTTYGIRLMGASTNRGTLYDPIVAGVYDSAGTMVPNTFVDDARGLLDPIFQFTPTTTGTYYIATDGYDRFTGTARLAVTSDNVGSVNAGAPAVTVGTPVEGTIDAPDDVDRYSVSLTDANAIYYIRMLGYQSRNGDLRDPHINGIYFGTSTTNIGTALTDAAGTDVIIGTDAWFRVNTATAGGAGTYYIAATGNAGTDGAFLLSVDKDILGSQASTTTLSVGGSATSYIDEATDQDWFAVTLTAGQSYVIKMQGSYSGNGTLIDPRINGVRFLTATNTLTLQTGSDTSGVDNADGRDSVVRLTASTTGTYYINAQSSGSTVGSYRISVATEIGQNASTAGTLNIGSSVVGSIDDTTDVDWYAITVTAGTAYVFKMIGVDGGGGTLDDPVITSIVNSGGSVQTGVTINSAGMDSYARWIPGTSGTYYLNVTGAGTDSGTFTLSAVTEVPDAATGAPVLAIGGSVNGTIDAPGDPDWYSITVAANTAYVFKMEGRDSGLGTLADATITSIVDSGRAVQAGTIITDAGSDAYARWISGSAGTYFINVTGAGINMGTFRLSAATEIGHTSASASSHTIGGSVNGAIDVAGDVDWYGISVTANTAYVFKMEGAKGGVGTLNGAMITSIVNSTGGAQTGVTVTTSGSDAYATWVATGTGTYYLNLTGVGSSMGTFRLSSAIEIGNTSTSASSYTIGNSVNGNIDVPGDSDWYSVSLTANTGYVFRMQGLDSGLGTLTGANISIVNASGAAQAGVSIATSGSDAYATWAPTAGGTYYINVSGSSTNSGTFRLSSSTEIGNTITSNAAHTIGNTVNGTIDVPGDTDWYAVTLNANTAYLFRVQGVDSGNGTLGAAAITGIFGSTGAAQSGVSIATSGSDAFATWTPTANGTYYIGVAGSGTSSGTFKLSSGTETIGTTTGSAGSLSVNGTVNGNIDVPGDNDWYAISLTANTAYLFRMQGPNGVAIGGILNGSGVAQSGVLISSSGSESYATWIAASTTTYYINATGTTAGAFTLNATTEVGNTTTSYGTINVGSSASGTIDVPGDSDWYRVALSNSTSYVFRVSGVSSNGGTLADPNIVLLNSSGTVVSTGVTIGEHGTDTTIRFTTGSTGAGNYFLDVQGGGTAGTYTLTAATETGTTTGTAQAITLNTPFNGMIEDTSDADWFSISLTANVAYTFKMEGVDSGGGTLGGAVITSILNGSNATQNATIVTSGSDAYATFAPTANGTYYINVTASGTNIGSFRLTASTEAVGNTTTSYATINVGNSASGTIDVPGDSDWYRVALANSTGYVFRVSGVSSNGGTLADPNIVLRNSTGAVVATGVTTGEHGTDTTIRFTTGSTGAGNYFLDVQGSGTAGTYTVTAALEPGTTSTSAGAITLNTPFNGMIEDTTDADWYGISLTANTAYMFKMEGVDSGGGTLGGAVITSIVNASGVAQTGVSIVTSGSDSYATWTPTGTGATTYYINVTASGTNIGSFRLTASTEAVGTTTASAATLPLTGFVNGTIDVPGDNDWYKVTLTANTPYIFRMQGADTGGGTLGGAAITSIMDSNGAVQSGLSIATSGSDAFASWTPTTGGTYYINVTGTGANAGTFRLSATTDAVGTTAGSAVAYTVGNTANGTIDAPSDTDWYSVSLNANTAYVFRVQGADNGVSTLAGASINIVNASGATQAGVVTSTMGSDAFARWVPGTTGTYYISVTGAGANSGTFRLTSGTEVAHTTASTSTITVGGTVTGTADMPSDSDWYKFTHNSSTGYIVRISGVDGGGGTLTTPVINGVYTSGGVALTNEVFNTNGTDIIMRWSPTSATVPSDYFIDVGSGSSMGTYTVRLNTEVGDNTTVAPTLTIGNSVNGTFEDSTDTDWYKVTLTNNTAYIFRITGGTVADPHIVLRNSTGTEVSTGVVTIENGTETIIRFATSGTNGGTYHIDAQSNGSAGTFTLTTATEVGASTTTARALTVGTSAVGTIDDTADADWYSVALAANTSYAFRISSSGGTLADPHIVLRNSSGTEVTTGVTVIEDGTDTTILYTTSFSSGTWYIDAQGSGEVGTYTVTAALDPGTTTGSSEALAVGTPIVGTIDTATDADWYSVALVANASYVFRMSGVSSNGGTLADPDVVLRTSTGLATGVVNSESGTDALVRFATGGTGTTYYLAADGNGTTGTFTLSATREAGDTNATSMAITLGAGTPVYGSIDDATDVDRYSVTLAANTQYRVRMEGLSSNNGTLADPLINGVRLGTNANLANSVADGGGTGTDAVAIFKTGTSGVHYIDVDASADFTGTYKLTIELWP